MWIWFRRASSQRAMRIASAPMIRPARIHLTDCIDKSLRENLCALAGVRDEREVVPGADRTDDRARRQSADGEAGADADRCIAAQTAADVRFGGGRQRMAGRLRDGGADDAERQGQGNNNCNDESGLLLHYGVSPSVDFLLCRCTDTIL